MEIDKILKDQKKKFNEKIEEYIERPVNCSPIFAPVDEDEFDIFSKDVFNGYMTSLVQIIDIEIKRINDRMFELYGNGGMYGTPTVYVYTELEEMSKHLGELKMKLKKI